MHGDPDHPKKNPHPIRRYEVTATSDAPGEWDSVKGYISYEVVNPACTPEDKFLGVHKMPQDVAHDVEMTRVNETTWKGNFYRDFLVDEDYYGLGVCHWDATSAGGVFVVHGGTFGSSDMLDVLIRQGPQTEFFKKSDFLEVARAHGGYGTTSTDPLVSESPDAFFPITVTVKELTP